METPQELLKLKKVELIDKLLEQSESTEAQIAALRVENASLEKKLLQVNEDVASKDAEIANLASKAEANASHWHELDIKNKGLEGQIRKLESQLNSALMENQKVIAAKADWKHFSYFLALVCLVLLCIFIYIKLCIYYHL